MIENTLQNLQFQGIKLTYKARDFLRPREILLSEVPIKPGDAVLDYGCGPGSYTFVVSKIVGPQGRVYALDVEPLVIKHVENLIRKRNIENIRTILSDCETGLPDESIDVILLFDIFHLFNDPNRNLRELHRVLKKNGILSFSDHHMDRQSILEGMTAGGWFRFLGQGSYVFTFTKNLP
ncbi:MAG: class I SAM-dependent methyltransferase [candidate division KSB1 bacterium]|nr:class I SAM-dependent methyltransferase [candidate division KSB1 bacterium]MDZ7345163.1 class I SAM-dependent methyltransferase [candidate division KSB1 bacterium]